MGLQQHVVHHQHMTALAVLIGLLLAVSLVFAGSPFNVPVDRDGVERAVDVEQVLGQPTSGQFLDIGQRRFLYHQDNGRTG